MSVSVSEFSELVGEFTHSLALAKVFGELETPPFGIHHIGSGGNSSRGC